MSKLTLDEAIKHCLEVVEKNEQAKKDGNLWIDTEYEDCCADHRQLAKWLTELRDRQWVICKDRMPEIIDNISSADVLIRLENGEQYVAILIGEDNENQIEAYWSTSDMHRHFECDVVTHWHPLPEEPKMGGSENG